MFAYCGNNPITFSDPSGYVKKHYDEIKPVCLEGGYSYIYDQEDPSISSLQLGRTTIGKLGCGVVATYNALLDLGEHISFDAVYDWYTKHLSVFDGYGKHGVFIGTVASYFTEHGYDVVVLISWDPAEHQEYAQKADACIMLYRYKTASGKGGHYFAYHWAGNKYRGRNTLGGSAIFSSPWDYGTQGNRYFAYEIFIFDRRG